MKAAKEEVKNLTKKDVVVKGGTKDVRKYVTRNGCSKLKDFARENSHTNKLFKCVSQTYLIVHVNSCVKKEVDILIEN
jgi:type IV secretory pathway TrbF-like protein